MEASPHPEASGASSWWASEHTLEPPVGQHHAEEQDQGVYQLLLDKIQSLENRLDARSQGELIDPLNMTVTPELKTKIWSQKFIDLSQLLSKNYQTLEEDANKNISGYQDEDGNITLKAVKQKHKSSLTIDEWSSAFNTLISVNVLKHPDDLQGMLSYAELVRSAARDHPDSPAWRQYDEEFRTKKAARPSRPWGMIDNHLWLSMFSRPQTKQNKQNTSNKSQKEGLVDKKSSGCIFFNKPAGCFRKKCSYTHACSSCGGRSHGAANCWHQKENKDKSTTDQNKKAGSETEKQEKAASKHQQGNRSFRPGNRS